MGSIHHPHHYRSHDAATADHPDHDPIQALLRDHDMIRALADAYINSRSADVK